jgi:anti-sigma factor RsiW
MGNIFRLHDDPHEETEKLLPWYVTGQLDPVDRAKVEGHLRDCTECQVDLRLERRLNAEVADLPLDVALGWADLQRRLDRAPSRYASVGRAGAAIRRWAARPGKIGWFLAAQAVFVVAIAIMVVPVDRPAAYRTLGAAPISMTGNIIVIFRPDTSERDLRRALNASGARLVDGPTSAAAYVLRVPAAERMSALGKLRTQPDVVMAEPIDPAAPL